MNALSSSMLSTSSSEVPIITGFLDTVKSCLVKGSHDDYDLDPDMYTCSIHFQLSAYIRTEIFNHGNCHI